MIKITIGFAFMFLLGCVPIQAAASFNNQTIPQENVSQCVQLCQSAAMTLSALVVIGNRAGCVCEPPQTAGNIQGASTAAVGGAVIQLIEEEEARKQAQQQQQQQQRQQQLQKSPF